jgi:hypothetical protein
VIGSNSATRRLANIASHLPWYTKSFSIFAKPSLGITSCVSHMHCIVSEVKVSPGRNGSHFSPAHTAGRMNLFRFTPSHAFVLFMRQRHAWPFKLSMMF